MQNRTKPYKNDLFEALEFEEIGEKGAEFGEFSAKDGLPARVVEWQIPNLGETAKKEARKFRIHPFAVRTGQAIAYVLIRTVSFVGQVLWNLALVLVFVLASVLQAIFGQGHRSGQRQGHRHRQDIDWRDVPTGWEAKGRHVRTSRQGQQNNINITVNIENH